jgi:hypothetical protein
VTIRANLRKRGKRQQWAIRDALIEDLPAGRRNEVKVLTM